MVKSDKSVARMWHEAVRLAGVVLVDSPGLPDREELHSVAAALLAAGLVSGKGKSAAVDHAGQDDLQNSMLDDTYNGGSNASGGSY